jgi:hypothetical protein
LQWSARTKTRHGDFGEQIIRDFWETEKKLKVLSPIKWVNGKPHIAPPDEPHDFDCIVLDGKGKHFFADCKAKARRNCRPDTGIDSGYFENYWRIYQGEKICPEFLDFILVFVDEHPAEERIYSLSFRQIEALGLDRLMQAGKIRIEQDRRATVTVYFDLAIMKPIRALTAEEAATLRNLSQETRRHSYA